MLGTLTKKGKKGREHRRNPALARQQAAAPIFIVNATATGSVLYVTYDQVVSLKGTPQYVLGGAGSATPVSAVQQTPTTVAVTYSASVASFTSMSITVNDPAVRNASGGFVAATGVSLP